MSDWIRVVLRTLRERQDGIKHIMTNLGDYIYRNVIEKSNIQCILDIFCKAALENTVSDDNSFRVLFITAYKGDSMRYRALNQAEQLILHGIECDIKSMWDPNLLKYVKKYDIFIFQRVLYSSAVNKLIDKINEAGKIAIYDVDDLVFDLELAKHLVISDRIINKRIFLKNVKRFEKALDKCKYALTTTEYLARMLQERKGKKAYVNRNCLSLEQIRVSEKAYRMRQQNDHHTIRIGYFSGTPTHDRDFLVVRDAIYFIMDSYKDVELYVGGFLNLDRQMREQFEGRIVKIPFVHWKKLPFEIAKVDINIAPLELDNPFCQGKSELKYIEAGILGIPTVATPTDAFKFAIEHGKNGLLAESNEEWIKCLEVLINSDMKREKIGKKARIHVLKYYNPYYRGKQFVDTLSKILNG